MKKIKKLFSGMLMVGIGMLLVPNIVLADRNFDVEQDDLSSNSANAVLNEIKKETFEIGTSWYGLSFDFVQNGSNYSWVATDDEESMIEVFSSSNIAVEAKISWEAAISGVEASYLATRTDRTTACIVVPDYMISYPEARAGIPIYSDSSCTTEVVGEIPESTTVYYNGNTFNDTDLGSTDIILLPANYGDGVWNISLSGGSIDDVEAALLTPDKKIGQFTVTFSRAE